MVDFKTGDSGNAKINTIIVKETTTQILGKSIGNQKFTIFINGARYVVSSDEYKSQKEIYSCFYEGKKIEVIYYPPTDETLSWKMEIGYDSDLNSFEFEVL